MIITLICQGNLQKAVGVITDGSIEVKNRVVSLSLGGINHFTNIIYYSSDLCFDGWHWFMCGDFVYLPEKRYSQAEPQEFYRISHRLHCICIGWRKSCFCNCNDTINGEGDN